MIIGSEVLKDMFKRYLSDEDHRNEIFSETEGVDHMSLLQMNENSLYVINKALVRAILKKNSFVSEYIRLEEDVLMQELGCALNELCKVTKEGVGNFVIGEMEKFELAKEQYKNR
ncbi:hypothetical protein TNIN_2521 [Trichonephila inaurata madagascariensis]|uniref:Uncharacterized protein n=1 Tax=Trichonephila inaurata madagascariensis TaxID=2747483 RepID=A0A8X6WQI6_9ARAC|nr:hypothetical protein TNIN_2521 [Trichonephila inaurata madagascariensis]